MEQQTQHTNNILKGKRILVTGVVSKLSIAAGIADALHRAGAELAFTYQNEKLKSRVSKMAEQWGSQLVFPCDVSSDEEISNLVSSLQQHWDYCDGFVHSIAFAPADQLQGDFFQNVSREGFKIAHDISSYSLSALAKALYPLMENRAASIIALSYLGANRCIPNYNVMGLAKASLEANVRYLAYSMGPKGIRVNAVSAGPIRTLAASGIKNFKSMLNHNEQVTPLRRNVTIEEVGQSAAFLCSDMASAITGEVLHVDAGFHIVGLGDQTPEMK
jgi:enoyl-[acyl-carrier protein] reductase I